MIFTEKKVFYHLKYDYIVGRNWKQFLKSGTLYFATYQDILPDFKVQNTLNSFSIPPIQSLTLLTD